MSERKSGQSEKQFNPVKVGLVLAAGAGALYALSRVRRANQASEAEEQKPSPLIVTYDRNLDRAPYNVTFNERGYRHMLNDLGMDDERNILGKRIHFSRFQSDVALPALGSYNPFSGTISVYTDHFWKKYQADVSEMNNAINTTFAHETKHMLDCENLQWKLVGGLRVAAALGLYGIFMFGTHPSGMSMFELYQEAYGYWATLGIGLINGLTASTIVYGLDPMELRARNFARQHGNINLLKITPK